MKKYIVMLEGNLFSPIKISRKTYKQALIVYNKLKEEFANTETIVSMNKSVIIEGEEITYRMYDKSLKKEKDFGYYVNMIDEALKALTEIKYETNKNISIQDKMLSNFYHTLEVIDTSNLTSEEMQTFFENSEIALAKRRLAKFDFDLNNSAMAHLNQIKVPFGKLKAAKLNSEKNKNKKQITWEKKMKEDNPYLNALKRIDDLNE